MNRLSQHDELLLIAFQYVSGELNESDAARFESRLAEDEAAQQAVADAVLLSDSLLLQARVRPVRGSSAAKDGGRHRAFVAAAVAAVAVVLIALAWPGAGDLERALVDNPRHADDLTPAEQSAGSLLAVWSEMSAGAAEEPESLDSADDPAAAGSPASDADELPEWLLHAVAEAQGALAEPSAPSDDPADDELDEET